MTVGVGLVDKCVVKPRTNDGTREVDSIFISETVTGAQYLIDNFVHNYRCTANAAADGRQVTDIPAFLSLVGTSAAVAFGAGSDTAIAGGVANGIFANAGKYWAAQKKAEILNQSLDALLCIKTEAVGISAVTLAAISETQNKGAKALMRVGADDPGAGVTVSAEKQYFDLVSASLMAVERITAQRLSVAGSPFDAESVIKQIQDVGKERDAAEAPGSPAEQQARAETQQVQQLNSRTTSSLTLAGTPTSEITTAFLKLNTLQPRLQQCVLRAKI